MMSKLKKRKDDEVGSRCMRWRKKLGGGGEKIVGRKRGER